MTNEQKGTTEHMSRAEKDNMFFPIVQELLKAVLADEAFEKAKGTNLAKEAFQELRSARETAVKAAADAQAKLDVRGVHMLLDYIQRMAYEESKTPDKKNHLVLNLEQVRLRIKAMAFVIDDRDLPQEDKETAAKRPRAKKDMRLENNISFLAACELTGYMPIREYGNGKYEIGPTFGSTDGRGQFHKGHLELVLGQYAERAERAKKYADELKQRIKQLQGSLLKSLEEKREQQSKQLDLEKLLPRLDGFTEVQANLKGWLDYMKQKTANWEKKRGERNPSKDPELGQVLPEGSAELLKGHTVDGQAATTEAVPAAETPVLAEPVPVPEPVKDDNGEGSGKGKKRGGKRERGGGKSPAEETQEKGNWQ